MYLLPTHLAEFAQDALCALLVFSGPNGSMRFIGALKNNPPAGYRLAGIVAVFEDGQVIGRTADEEAGTMAIIQEAGRRYMNSLRALGVINQTN